MATNAVPEEPWTPADTFGNRLRLIRAELGYISVDDISEMCGLKSPTWSTWERGVHPHRMHEVVGKIAQATNVDPQWLMWGGSRSGSVSTLGLVPPFLGQLSIPFPERDKPVLCSV